MAENTKNCAVIDASFMLAAILPDELYEEAEIAMQKYLNGTLQLFTSPIFPFEVANGIRVAVIRKRLAENIAKKILRKFLDLSISTVPIDMRKTFTLAHKHNLTIYDASYIYLARVKHAHLLTNDEKMKKLITL